MEFIVMFAVIIITASAIAVKSNQKIEQCIPISVMGMILIVYLFGLFEQLRIGITIIEILTLIALFYLIIKIILEIKKKKIKELIQKILTPGLVVYTMFYILFIWINKDTIFTFYDEFNHWGLLVKNMYFYDSFGTNPESIVQFNEYPPFTAIFQYIFITLKGNYSESTIVIASNILYVSMIMPIFKNIEGKKDLKKLLIYIPIILFLPMLFYKDFYKLITVDGLLGIFFAYILYTWCEEKDRKFRNMSVAMGLVSLSLIKYSGMGLSILILLIIIGDVVRKKKEGNIKSEIISVSIFLLIFLIFMMSWQIKITNAHKEWNMGNINSEAIKQIPKDSQGIEIIKKYVNTIFTKNIITEKNITLFSILLIIMACSIYMVKKLEGKYKYYSIMLMISSLIYMIMLLFTYLFVIPRDESSQIVCFDRYIGTILLGISMFYSYILLEKSHNFSKNTILIAICVMFAVFPTTTIIHKCFFAQNDKLIEIQERKSNMEILKYQNSMKQEDKIYFITNVGKAQDKSLKIARYLMSPISIINTKMITVPKELKEILQNEKYTHLYIFKIDDKLKAKMEEEFKQEIKEETMYEIQQEDFKLTEVIS